MNKNGRMLSPVPREAQIILPPQRPNYAGPIIEGTPHGISLAALLKRRWKWLAFSSVVSLLLAIYVMQNHSRFTWTYTSTLLFKRGAGASGEYVSPGVATLASLIESPTSLQTLREDFQLTIPREAVANSIETHVPYGADAISISLTWGNPEECRVMLTRLVEIFTNQVTSMRQAALETAVRDAEAHLLESKTQMATAKEALLLFSRQQDVVDVERDLGRLQEQIAEIELTLETARLAHANGQAQLRKLTEARDESTPRPDPAAPVTASNAPPAQAAATAPLPTTPNGAPQPAAPNSPPSAIATGPQSAPPVAPEAKTEEEVALTRRVLASVDLQRRGFLQERIREEQARIERRSKIALARQELERTRALHAKRYISDAEFERAEAELQVLLDQERGSTVVHWQEELESINARMPSILYDNFAYGMMTPAALAQTAAQLELELVASEGQIEHLEKYLELKEQELARVTDLRREAQVLQEVIEVTLVARQKAEFRVASLKHALQSDADSFAIIEPAGPALYPVSSNARRLFVLTLVGVGLLLVTPAVVREYFAQRERPVESAARRLGLPVLARSPTPLTRRAMAKRDSAREDECPRMLALRIQQFLEKPGSVMLFSSLNQLPPSIALIARVAHCFVQRGERVVLVDIGKTVESRQGFADLVADGVVKPSEGEGSKNGASESGLGVPRFLTRAKPRTNGELRGVADYIAGTHLDADELIVPSKIVGVDCLLAGSVPLPPEGLASRRMTDLLDQLRQKYSRVIVIGPSTAFPVDLEMLAARVDGIVFNTVGPRADHLQGEDVVSNLIDLNAPILGFVA